MSKNKIRSNLVFQIIYQILIVITPLITSPYISRILGADGIGIYSYSYSIANYFMILIMLGTNTYGCKVIAKVQNDKEECSKIFFEIYSLQALIAILSIIMYLTVIQFNTTVNFYISLIQLLLILSSALNINWFFFGLEKFKLTTLRNIIFKILIIFCIFMFVKDENDLWVYVLIMGLGELLSQFFMFVLLKRYIILTKISISGIVRHIKPNILLFLPGIAFALNNDLDKTMITLFRDFSSTGFYYNAEKLVKIPVGIITGIGVVMLPFMTKVYLHDDKDIIKGYLSNSIQLILLICFALCFGIISISNELVPLFFGPGYEDCIILIRILSLSIIFQGISNVIRTQYLIPNNYEKQYSLIVIFGALINLILNIFFIINFGAIGAAIATLISELVVCFIGIVILNKNYNIIKDLSKCLIYIIPSSATVFLVRFYVSQLSIFTFYNLIIEILFGGIVYILISLPCFIIINPKFRQQVSLFWNKICN